MREVLETAVITLFIFFVVQIGIQNYKVLGSSMEPNLHQGQYLLVNKIEYRLHAPARGDIIVFHYPNNPSDDYVKRIIGLPGETLEIRDGAVYADGVQLDEPYLRAQTTSRYTGVVPEDTVFVMGDNRGNSSDSRSWGALPLRYIVGRAVLCYWPPEQWTILPGYSYAMP
ncbi:MAG: signal peptidase I [Chloroflexi bacterium]|nr:signal peptidase I [Chloroflexota bacterium]MBU1751732.1 signal peptidase I [Chloroflexota bacterium]